jgi:hypothetical protein
VEFIGTLEMPGAMTIRGNMMNCKVLATLQAQTAVINTVFRIFIPPMDYFSAVQPPTKITTDYSTNINRLAPVTQQINYLRT